MNRRVRVEKDQLNQDITALNHAWNTQSKDAVGVPQLEEVGASNSDSEQEAELPSFTPRHERSANTPDNIRRQPGRRCKQRVNYKGMFALFSKGADASQEATSCILDNDSAFLSTLDLHGEGFKSTPATRAVDQHIYLSQDSTYENVHPLAFISKV